VSADRPAGTPAAAAVAREIGLVLALGAVVGSAGWVLAAAASYQVRIGLVVALAVAMGATWRLFVAVRPPPPPEVAATGDDEPAWGGFADLSAIEYRLSWGSVDAERYETRLRPQLARIAEERLRQRHGVDPARRPDVARRIVGEPLWQLMTEPPAPGPPPSPARLADMLAHIERI